MIINVRGGSGAGKSTVIREIMDQYDVRTPHFIEGRKQPLWYDLTNRDPEGKTLRVLGHYETPCGGCDTISKNPGDPDEKAMAFIHRLVREADDAGCDVLYEGVILTTILGELPQLHEEGRPLVIINLTSDLETCLLGISARRVEKVLAGAENSPTEVRAMRETLSETTVKNNVGKLRSAIKTATQLRNIGVCVFDCDREQAVVTIEETLGGVQ